MDIAPVDRRLKRSFWTVADEKEAVESGGRVRLSLRCGRFDLDRGKLAPNAEKAIPGFGADRIDTRSV